jgi:hypothetical protein
LGLFSPPQLDFVTTIVGDDRDDRDDDTGRGGNNHPRNQTLNVYPTAPPLPPDVNPFE